MARNGSGTYNRAVSPYTAGTTITAATVNSEMEDIATALTGSMARDGQSPATANIPMGGFRLTGLGNAISNTDAAPLGQVVAKAGDTMTGAFGFAVGTAALPGVFVAGDTNTGLFQPSADTLAVTVGGTEVARFGANGLQSAAPWVDLASATTTDLGAQTSTNLRITGTTTITGFGTVASGTVRNLRFADALTLTHNGTSLILPGGANVTTAAGDTATAVSLGSGNWVVTAFQRAAGLPLAQMTTARVLGRVTAGNGAIEEIPLGNAAAALSLGINRGTEQATTSGAQIDFTSIPAGVRRITVMFEGVSFNGSDGASIQLGDSDGIETTGYVGQIGIAAGTSAGQNLAPTTAAQVIYTGTAAVDNCSGVIFIVNQSGNKWLLSGNITRNGTVPQIYVMQASKTLSDVLDRIRFKVDGANSFDAGSINIMWEF
jgi:hypothetical protein